MAGISVEVKPEIISWILHIIQFDNVAYRIVSMSTGTENSSFLPHFAFPVSD